MPAVIRPTEAFGFLRCAETADGSVVHCPYLTARRLYGFADGRLLRLPYGIATTDTEHPVTCLLLPE